MVRITLFGQFIRYWVSRIPQQKFERMQVFMQTHELPLEELLFNLEILQHFGYENWTAINPVLEGGGWLMTKRNWLEISVGKRKRKTMMDEFISNNALFDLYLKQQIQINYTHNESFVDVLIYQMETGLTRYVCLNPHMNLDEMLYTLAPPQLSQRLSLDWVENVLHKNTPLNILMNEKLVTDSSAIILHANH